jgi:hypothetical protein
VHALEHGGPSLPAGTAAGVDAKEASLRAWKHTLAPLLQMPPEWLSHHASGSSSSSGSVPGDVFPAGEGGATDGAQLVAALCPGCSPAVAAALAAAAHARGALANGFNGSSSSGSSSGSSGKPVVSSAAAAAASAASAAELEFARLMADDMQTLEALPFPV